MPLDYSLDANINPYFPCVSTIQTAKFDEMKFKNALPDARNPLPLDPTGDLAYVPLSSARLSSHKPRVVSDSAVLLGQSQDKTTSSDPSYALRYQRTLSVGCQPYSRTQGLNIGPDNPTQITTDISPEINEQYTDQFGIFQDSLGTSSGLGYDGTRPIAYIQVHNPQRYSLRTTNSIHALRNADLFQIQPKGEAHPMVYSIHSQIGDQAIHTQQLAPRDRAANQSSTRRSTLDLYSDLHTQTTLPLNSGHPYLSTEPMVRNKVTNHRSNISQSTSLYCGTSTLTAPETQSSRPDPPDRDRAGNKPFSTNEFNSHSNSSLVHSTMQVQAIPSPVLTQGPDLVGPDYALEIPRNSLQDQAIAENLVFRDTLLPKFDTVHASTPCNSDPSFRQGPFNYPSSVPYEHSPHGVHTWSQISPSPVARNEFQSTPILVVPAPQRSLNYGAFLTPDPPCQISNIDLPPRPGTSPLRQTSALNGKLRLLPNIGRRRSEQTWQSYGSQSDSVRLPELPPPPEDIGQFGGDNYAPSSLAVSVETHALGPPTDNVRTHQLLIQQPVVSSTRKRPSAPKPGPAQDHETAKSTVCQNRSSKERRQSNPKQMHQRAILPSTQSGNSQERTNQKFWPPKVEPSTQVVSSATEEHSSWRTTTAKRRCTHSNPENMVPAKKRKVVGEISEVTSTEPESTPVTHSQSQEQNAPKPGQDCVYFDVNTWRGDNIADQEVPQSLSAKSSEQTQLQSGDGRSTESSLGKSTQGSSGKSGETVSPSEPSQLSYGDGEVPPGGSENWLPVVQGDGGDLQYMNWGPSVNMLLDQTLAFNLEVSGALDPAPEQCLTALIPVYPLEPNNFEIEGLADYYNMGIFSTVA